jgi:hypothetical protein
VSFEHIRIGKLLDLGEAPKSRINAGREGGVFKAPDYVGVFLPGDITQVPARFEIAKRIERHGLASRR